MTEKDHQGGAGHKSSVNEKRVYATGGPTCTVKVLQYFISKQNPNASMVFNKYEEKDLTNPDTTHTQYVDKALAKRTFEIIMRDISAAAGLRQIFTAFRRYIQPDYYTDFFENVSRTKLYNQNNSNRQTFSHENIDFIRSASFINCTINIYKQNDIEKKLFSLSLLYITLKCY